MSKFMELQSHHFAQVQKNKKTTKCHARYLIAWYNLLKLNYVLMVNQSLDCRS